MVPMPMAPYHRLNAFAIDPICFKLFSNSGLDTHVPVFNTFFNGWGEILQVFAYTEIEDERASGGVLDEEGEGWARESVKGADFRRVDKASEGDVGHVRCGVDYADGDGGLGGGDLEVWWGGHCVV
jgi:hypothetical protein